MKVTIDLEKCYRAGECYYNHPEVFAMSEDGDPQLKLHELDDNSFRRHVEQAAQVCPSGAIVIDD